MPPPPQSFSDSPRKRRGRGYTTVAVTTTAGNNSGALKRSSGSTSKRQGVQSKVAGFNTTDYHTRSNLSTTCAASATDNNSYSPPEAMPSIPNTSIAKCEDGIEPDSNKLNATKLTTGTSASPHTTALSSIVSVETKHHGKVGSSHTNTAAV